MTVVDEMHADPGAFAARVAMEPTLATFEESDGNTLLHRAINYPEVIHALLSAGADPNRLNQAGNTPVHLAAKWVQAKSLELLIAAGGDAAASDGSGRTPLDWAHARNRPDIEAIITKSRA